MRHIDILGVRDLLDAKTSGELGDGKPSPDIFQVGDSVDDAVAARRAGLCAFGVESGSFGERQLREAGAVVVFRDIADMLENCGQLRAAWARAA